MPVTGSNSSWIRSQSACLRERFMPRPTLRSLVSGIPCLTLRVWPRAACIIIVFLLIESLGIAAAPEMPKRIAGTERVQVNLVLIDIVVRDRRDQPVLSLTRDDFELRIDGVTVD